VYYSIPACFSIFYKKLTSFWNSTTLVQPANIPLLRSKIMMCSGFKALSSSCIMAIYILAYRNRNVSDRSHFLPSHISKTVFMDVKSIRRNEL
jgi:hypothetical protein